MRFLFKYTGAQVGGAIYKHKVQSLDEEICAQVMLNCGQSAENEPRLQKEIGAKSGFHLLPPQFRFPPDQALVSSYGQQCEVTTICIMIGWCYVISA